MMREGEPLALATFRMLVDLYDFDGGGRPPRGLWLDGAPGAGQNRSATGLSAQAPARRAVHLMSQQGGQADGG